MKRRPEGRPWEARSGCLCGSLGLLCKRVARGYDQIGTGVGDTVFRVVVRAEVTRDEDRSSLLEELFGDCDFLGAVLGEHHGVLEEGGHTLAEVVGDGEAGDLAVLSVEEASI